MATKASKKKSAKKAPKKPSGAPVLKTVTPMLESAAAAGDAHAALMAVSTAAGPEDAKRAIIFNCIVTNFHQQGFPEINDQQARIVWTTIPDNIIIALGNGVTNCITAKDFTCPALAPAFQNLKNMGQVTTVADLITGIAVLVRP